MIDGVDQTLKAWVAEVLPDATISMLPPGQDKASSVTLYLYDLRSATPTAMGRRPALQIQCHYLVCTQHEKPEKAHHMLSQLLFSALENDAFTIDFETLSPEFWTAFKLPPQAAFRLSLPLRMERKQAATLVRMPMELNQSPLVSMSGLVLGPNEVPIADARVELDSHRLNTHTDSKGRFLFPSVPALPKSKKIKIKARNRVYQVEAELSGSKDKPLIIHFDAIGE